VLSLYESDKVSEKTGVAGQQLASAAKILSGTNNCYVIYGDNLANQNDTDLVTALLNLTYLIQKGAGDKLNFDFPETAY